MNAEIIPPLFGPLHALAEIEIMSHAPAQTRIVTTDSYYQRFGALEPQIHQAPWPDLGLIVVIPCFDEPDLLRTLNSLKACHPPQCAVEIIVVINSSETASQEVLSRNRETLIQGLEWSTANSTPEFQCFFLHFPSLPAKQAGVGLARKIGMDEAARRFDQLDRANGVIVCLDADSECEPNYLTALELHFQQHKRTPGCSITFEHPLNGPLPSEIYRAITLYELHLRYYVLGLRLAAFPHAFHTIGSSMAVRSGIYKKQGGMNKRQAGEDFYFLHKIIPLGGFTELNSTHVVPSPRASHRVPFGTGKAVQQHLEHQELTTYPLEAFLDLHAFFRAIQEHGANAFQDPRSLPASISSYLAARDFVQALQEIVANTTSRDAFLKRFFHWFNGFEAMKFVHHARDKFYGEREIEAETRRLAAMVWPNETLPRVGELQELLIWLRAREKAGELLAV
ncbi:MAG TPA: glycosyltransferase [Candidatus Saccharimonadales bacterium]|nr:glycosyltransferase [Candidatus Saccharimonadales bacterium]